ncbi:MAG: sigma-70 family RNA polymerase sigma factor [Planctomycetia bacterium]|nr:sigma-70 family RNA polymerase sigma factor [Planctomycetia bacterium]
MSQCSVHRLLHCLKQAVGAHDLADFPDRLLLERFVQRQDERAFALLVQRHGGLVWGVCKRLLPNRADAEDVFQATFLVLVQKAGSLERARSLGGWLYKVAYHIALRARARIGNRNRLEALTPARTESDASEAVADAELRQLIDHVLHDLPEKHRAPLVLCYLQGKTNAEAARELGWPLGSMSGRLAQARELLRKRLAHRGVALSTGTLSALAAESLVPAALAQATVQAADLLAAGQAAAQQALPGGVAALLEGTMHTMLLAKIRFVAAVLLALGVLASATGLGVYQLAGAQPPAAEPPAAAAPVKKEEEKPVRADVFGDPLPPHALARLGTVRMRHPGLVFVTCLPDGKRAITSSNDGPRLWDIASGKEIRRFTRSAEDDGSPLRKLLENAFRETGLDGDSMTDMMDMMSMYSANGRLAGDSTVAVAPDGKTLATANMGGQVTLWDIDSGKLLRQFKPGKPAFSMALAFSPNSQTLAVQSNIQVVLCEVATGKVLRRIGKELPPRERKKQDDEKQDDAAEGELFAGFGGNLAFSADGKELTVWEATIKDKMPVFSGKVYDAATGQQKRTFKGPGDPVGLAILSPDGKLLAWGGATGVTLWDVAADKELHQFTEPLGGDFDFPSLAFAPDSRLLAARVNGVVKVFETATGEEKASLELKKTAPPADGDAVVAFTSGLGGSALAFAPDGKTLLAAGEFSTVQVWDVASGKARSLAGGHQGAVLDVQPAADGRSVATRGQDNWVRRWQADNGKETGGFELPAGAASSVFSPDGKIIAFVGADRLVHLVEVAHGKELRTCEGKLPAAELAFSADGTVLAGTADYQSIQLWETATGKPIRQLVRDDKRAAPAEGVFNLPLGMPGGTPPGLVFSPDGRLVAAASANRGQVAISVGGQIAQPEKATVCLYDVATGKLLRKLEGPKNGIATFAFSPDGRILATANFDRSITFWETATGLARRKLKADSQDGRPSRLTFSPDGRTLVLGTAPRTLRFWDVASGTDLGKLEGHQSQVTSVAYAPDGRTLLSGSSDTTALVWDLAALKPAPRPEAVALTAEQADGLWNDLAATDGAQAEQAIATLVRGQQSVALLAAKVKPATPADPQQLARLLTDLHGDKLATRQEAAASLEKLGELAEPAVVRALEEKPGLEARQRLEQVRDKLLLGTPRPETVQGLRTLEVLERIATPEARAAIQKLAEGASGARLTREAQATLKRLK